MQTRPGIDVTNSFVTGGAGFVGRHLLQTLCESDHDVASLVVSADEESTVTAIGAIPIAGTVHDEEILRSGMHGKDVVFHIAGRLGVSGSYRDFHRVNVQGTERVLNAAQDSGVSRLVYVSAAAVVSTQRAVMNVEESTLVTGQPIGNYARSKLQAERLVLEANGPSLTTVVIRPPAIWGLGDSALLTGLIKRVLSGRFFWIDNGHYPYSTCHVHNVCEGMLLAAERGEGGQAYFLTDGDPMEFREFATLLLRTQGLEPGTRNISRRLAQILASVADSAARLTAWNWQPPINRTVLNLVGSPFWINDGKARRELNYQARFTVQQGLDELARAATVIET